MIFFDTIYTVIKSSLPFLYALIGFITVDFITGFSKGLFVEGVSSAKMKQSAKKILRYFALVFCSWLIDTLSIMCFEKFNTSLISVALIIWSSTVEAKSIMENLSALGFNVPDFVFKKLEKFTQEERKNNESD